jgi:hypothetical protein
MVCTAPFIERHVLPCVCLTVDLLVVVHGSSPDGAALHRDDAGECGVSDDAAAV